MGIFHFGFGSKKDSLYDYLDSELDKAKYKIITDDNFKDIQFMKLAMNIASTYIATAISTCEFKVYERGNQVKDINYYKLNISPNPNDTGTRFKYNLTKKLVREGSSLAINYKNYLYFADDFSIVSKDLSSLGGYSFSGITIQDVSIDGKWDIDKCFYFNLDDEKVEFLLKTIDSKYKSLLSSAVKAFQGSSSNKWKLKIDTVKQHSPEFQEEYNNYIQTQLKEFLKSEDAIYPELNGYELSKITDSVDKTDSTDITNLRKDIFELVAQTYKIPPTMMQGNMSNMKEIINEFITFAVKPYASLMGEEITRSIFSEEEILNGSKVIVDISTINYRDIFDVASGMDKLISTGVANIDEVRPLINFTPLNNDFSKQYWMTKNYSTIEDMLETSGKENKEGGDESDEEQ